MASLFGIADSARFPVNLLVEKILQSPEGLSFVAKLLASKSPDIFLMGSDDINHSLLQALASLGRRATATPWNFTESLPDVIPEDAAIVVTQVPRGMSEWEDVSSLTQRCGTRVTFIHQLGLKAITYATLFERFPLALEAVKISNPMDALDYYLGFRALGESIKQLARVYSLKNKRVIEFGPWSGLHTAFLVHHEASHITCVEARTENMIRLSILKELFDWNNVSLIQMDYHYGDANTLGRHDLVFAHGVHYHSVAPLVLLDHWSSLAPDLYYGAWCATDEKPAGQWTSLSDHGRSVRVKIFEESKDQFAGLDSFGYLFHADDIRQMFAARGFHVRVISDENIENFPFNRYLRLLVTRTGDR